MLTQQQLLRITDLVHKGALWPLIPAAIAMATLSSLRNVAFHLRLFKSTRVASPVISIGNLIAGGSGKTPLVSWMLSTTKNMGFQPAVIARGYGSAQAGDANDEAAMLPGQVFCHPKRRIAAQQALSGGANCLIMDDGFQHRKLSRDIDLICMDGTRPWGWQHSRYGAFLPYGILREGLGSLRRCHGVLITRYDQALPEHIRHIQHMAQSLQLPVWRCLHGPQALRPLLPEDAAVHELNTLQGKKVWLVSAIARPQAFTQTMHALGAQIVGANRFPDHHRYVKEEIQQVIHHAQAKNAQIICTEKDAAKLRPILSAFKQAPQLLVLEIAIQFINNDEDSLKEWLGKRLKASELS